MRDKSICLLLILLPWATASKGQRDTLTLTLEETVALAQQQSPTAQAAKHAFLAAQWQYRYFKANYLPSVTLSSSPCLNSEVNKITSGDSTSHFAKQNQLGTDISLTINQNIPLTGGSLYAKGSINRLDELESKTTSYSAKPFIVGYQQSLTGHNSLKWDKRIEPQRYSEARKNYSEAMELVAAYATECFFSMALAQSNLEMARLNLASADTLYNMARGRYTIGSINENEMLQLEINRLNEENACMDAETTAEEQTQYMRSFLGIERDVVFSLAMPDTVPDILFDMEKTLELAMENGADRDYYERIRLEGRSRLSQAKANARLRADLYMQFGLSQTGGSLHESLQHPQHQEYISMTLSLPILDWGRGRGQIHLAKSQLDLINTQAEQGMNDFVQNVRKLVMHFNMQGRKVNVATRTTQQADHRYDIARRLYVSGRNTILDLNAATKEKDSARRNRILAMQTWWKLYYTIRSMAKPPAQNGNSP